VRTDCDVRMARPRARPLSASYSRPWGRSRTVGLDWFHINSIDLEPQPEPVDQLAQHMAVYDIGPHYRRGDWERSADGTARSRSVERPLCLAARCGRVSPTVDRDLRQRGTRRRSRTSTRRSTSRSTSPTHRRDAGARIPSTPGKVVLAEARRTCRSCTNTDRLAAGPDRPSSRSFSDARNVLTFQLSLPKPVAPIVPTAIRGSPSRLCPRRSPRAGRPARRTTSIAASWNGRHRGRFLAGPRPVPGARPWRRWAHPVASSGFRDRDQRRDGAPYVAVQASARVEPCLRARRAGCELAASVAGAPAAGPRSPGPAIG